MKAILMKIAMMVWRPHAYKALNFAAIRQMLISCVKVTPEHSLRP